jgi:hypothetical protein
MARTRPTRTRTSRNAVSRPVTARTAARRARRLAAENAQSSRSGSRHEEPETIGQARVWTRKQGRYEIAGLCVVCAAQAAWGHAIGFQKIHDPCLICQPIVAAFPVPGPKGSKWKKILDKLEYMTEDELSAWLDAYSE